MLNHFNRDIPLKGTSIKQFLSTFIKHFLCSHLVAIFSHSTIQDGWTALERASIKGHQKVVELLLGAGANSDLQNKVRAGHMHANLSNAK